jgi:hypothetical protein
MVNESCLILFIILIIFIIWLFWNRSERFTQQANTTCGPNQQCNGANVGCCNGKCTKLIEPPCSNPFQCLATFGILQCPIPSNVGHICGKDGDCNGVNVGCCNGKCTNLVNQPCISVRECLVNSTVFQCPLFS